MKHLVILLSLVSFFALPSFAQENWQKTLVSAENGDPSEKPSNFFDIQRMFNDFWAGRTPSLEESDNGPFGGYQQFKRWEWFMAPRTFPTGEFFNPEILYKEYLKQKDVQRRLSIHRAMTAANWTFFGPDVVPNNGGGTGRINVVRIDPTNFNKIFVGSANGGLWISNDGGASWSTSTDLLPSLGVADIAINPRDPDTVYLATGDRDGYATGTPGHYTAGVLISADGGLTWNQTGLTYGDSQQAMMFRLLINPDNPDILLCATSNAIFRTSNAGVNWTNVRSGRMNDMEFKTDDSNTIFAASQSTLAVSSDGGATWTNRYTTLAGTNLSLIAVTAANSNVIYFFSASGAVKKSSDLGFNWTTMTSPSSIINMGQGWYDLALAVSPVNENVVFCAAGPNVSGGQGFARSINGGSSWSQVGTTNHVDHHDIEFEPGNGSVVYNTNDGSIYRSLDGGNNWENLGHGIDIKQYYRIGTSANTAGYLYAGAQDNGTDQLKAGIWTKTGCCDGMDCLMDYSNDNIAFQSWQNGNFARTTNGGSSFSNLTLPEGGAWVTPMVMDPITHTILYVGLTDVYKSVNSGTSWSPISSGLFGTSTITTLSIAPSDPNYIYAAVSGKIYTTRDAGNGWINITTGLPVTNAGISDVAISSLDPLKIWVSLSGFSGANKVFQSVNGGLTYTNITGSLPNIPTNCITYQKNSSDAVYLGTDFGVYYRDATMSDWISYNTGLPNVMIDELEIQYGTINKIRAATYGRGIWESDLNSPSSYSLDAGIQTVISPNNVPLCDSAFMPVVQIKNFGQATINTLDINYRIDSDPLQVYSWNGSLAPNAMVNITLPAYTTTNGSHTFTVFTSNPNSSADMNTFNDTRTVSFDIHSVPVAMPVQEGFEATSYPPANWTLDDLGNATQRWTTVGGFGNSTNSMRAKGFIVSNTYANLISYPLDFTTVTTAQVTFSLAYAMQDANSTEQLRLLVSTDCGANYTQVYSKTGTALATTVDHIGNFTPTASEWRTEIIDLSAYIGQSKVLIKFEFYLNAGNNIFVDDININSAIGIEELSSQNISVYPNPAKGILHFNIPNVKANTVIEIYSPVGSLAKRIPVHGELTDADISTLSAGIYFYEIKSESQALIQGKLVKE